MSKEEIAELYAYNEGFEKGKSETQAEILEKLKDYWIEHGVYCHKKAFNHAIDKTLSLIHIVCCEKCEDLIKPHLETLKKR